MATTVVFYNGVRDVAFDVEANGKAVRLIVRGSGYNYKGGEAKILPLAGAYGVTEVDAELWALVEKQYGDMKIFKDGLIKAGMSEKAKQEAKEEVSSKDNQQSPKKSSKKK